MKTFPILSFLLVLTFFANAQSPARLYTINQALYPATGGYGIGIDIDKPEARLHLNDRSVDRTALRIDMQQHLIAGVGNNYGMSLFAIEANSVDETSTRIQTVFTVDRAGKVSSGLPATINNDQVSVQGPLTVYQATNYSVGLAVPTSNLQPEINWRAHQNKNFRFRNINTNNTVMTLTQNGRVGINTENFFGNHRLYVDGSTYITENAEETHSLYIEGSSIAEEINVKPKNEWADITTGNTISMRFVADAENLIPEITWGSANAQNLTFKSSNTGNTPLTISPDGKVGINTDYFVNNHSLYIEGSSVAEEMYVKLKSN